MAHYHHLLIWKSALDLAMHLGPCWSGGCHESESLGFKHRTLTAVWRSPVSPPQKA